MSVGILRELTEIAGFGKEGIYSAIVVETSRRFKQLTSVEWIEWRVKEISCCK